jgi:hypothetical protein
MAPTSALERPRHRARQPGIELDCGAAPTVRHVGVVFVHGIGSQAAGETLLDWGGAIVRVLLDARVRNHRSADPVIDVQLDPGPDQSRFIEVQLPEVETDEGGTIPEQHWVMTEAWWAPRVRPPSFGQMADWLGSGGAITRIVDALITRKGGAGDPRLRPALEVRPLRNGADGVEEAPEPGSDSRTSRGWGIAPFWRWVGALGGNLYLRGVSALLLVLYGLLRAIEKLVPIGPLKDGALTRPLDSFVLDWFGDVYVLLGDSSQSASVRGRLIDALRDLDLAGCDRIAVVAHSGGAIVSYMTLSDPARKLRVDHLITLGEGLNLGWYLVKGKNAEQGAVESERLSRSIFEAHPRLEWDDFWGSQDPAPVGVLSFSATKLPNDQLRRVRSHATWNRLALGEDHGGYWGNDEEFLLPVMRLLEGEGRAPSQVNRPSLFGDAAADVKRSNQRRRRLSLLSLMRQSCLVAPMAAIIAAFAIGSNTAFRLSDAIATAWNWIPGTRLASDVLDYVRGLHLEDGYWMQFLAEAGVWIVAAVVAGTAAFSLLAPPERPLPWRHGGPGSIAIWLTLKVGPYLAGIIGAVLLVFGGWRFLSGSSPAARHAGGELLIGVFALVVLAAGLGLLASVRAIRASGVGYAVNVVMMSLFMVLVSGLVAAPVVAAVVYENVGRMILGSAAIVLAFQVVARLGRWRWDVWDAHERSAARTGIRYRGTGRVVTQILLLTVIIVGALVAAVFDSLVVAAVAGIALVVLVLMGVAIDVLDAVREERERPPESIRRFQLRA